jgi:hypothetical protein
MEMKMKKIIKLISILMLINLFGCASAPKISTDGLVKKVVVSQFENKTVQYNLSVSLTSMLTDELLREARVNVVAENQADYKVTGVVKKYELLPVSYTVDNKVETYEMSIYVDIKVMKISDNSVVWKDDFIGDGMYITAEGDPNVTSTNVELERTAQDRAIEYLAREIARRVANGN